MRALREVGINVYFEEATARSKHGLERGGVKKHRLKRLGIIGEVGYLIDTLQV